MNIMDEINRSRNNKYIKCTIEENLVNNKHVE